VAFELNSRGFVALNRPTRDDDQVSDGFDSNEVGKAEKQVHQR
jgi:hypothetical protein